MQNSLAIHLSRSLRDVRQNYRRRLKRCCKMLSEKAVHNLRVETRRLLAMLDFLEPARFSGGTKKLRKRLKKRLDVFDDLRDTQVHLELLKSLWRKFPEAKPLKKWLRRHERLFIKHAPKKTLRCGQHKLSQRLKELEQRVSAVHFSEGAVVDVLQKSFATVLDLRGKIRGRDPAAIHKLRVAFKRFRYLTELFQPFLVWATDSQLERMRQFQARAGDIQDLETLLSRIELLVIGDELSDAIVKRLRIELTRRKKEALDFFMEHVDDLREFNPVRAGRVN